MSRKKLALARAFHEVLFAEVARYKKNRKIMPLPDLVLSASVLKACQDRMLNTEKGLA